MLFGIIDSIVQITSELLKYTLEGLKNRKLLYTVLQNKNGRRAHITSAGQINNKERNRIQKYLQLRNKKEKKEII